VKRKRPGTAVSPTPDSNKSVGRPPFIQLDYLYVPSADVAKDLETFTGVLGGEVAFAVEGMGARVAMVGLTHGPPHVLLTDHFLGLRDF